MSYQEITSPDNQLIKDAVHMHSSSGRRKQGAFLAEGERCVSSLIEGGFTLDYLFIIQEQSIPAQTLLSMVEESRVRIISHKLMRKISQAHSPCGIIGQFSLPQEESAYPLSGGLVLAQIQDPGNMGTLIRTAAALNLTNLITITGSVDLWSYKVVQAAAGALAHMRIYSSGWQKLVQNTPTLTKIALVVENGKQPESIKQEYSLATSLLIVGNEANGIPHEWLADCDALMTLPMPSGKTESLNAAVAGSVALYLLTR
jgi:TrmH family RNA methyltransferase